MKIIDADALKANINTAFWSEIGKIIDSAPTIDAVSVVHGEWIVKQSGFAECSVCEQHYFSDYNFCPNCGAKMKGADDE